MPEISTKAMDQLNRRREALREDQQRWLAHYIDLQSYMLPRRGRNLKSRHNVTEVNDGGKKHDLILDGTATVCLRVLAAGFQAGLSSASVPWFALRLAGDDELNAYTPVKDWLYQVERAMFADLAESNVYNGLHDTYLEAACFGTATMGVYEDAETVFRARPYTIGEYMLGLDQALRVGAFIREHSLTVGQLVERFGRDECSDVVRRDWDEGNVDRRVPVCWMVERNDDRFELKIPRQRPYRSVIWEIGNDKLGKVLSVDGYDEFPVLCPRWSICSDNTYGDSAGMDALADTKQLQVQHEERLKAIAKVVSPPMSGPPGLYPGDIMTMPDGVTPVDDPTGALRPLYQINPDIRAADSGIEMTRASIRQALYYDMFLMIASAGAAPGAMTATEVAKRNEEKLLQLGPVLQNMHSELLGPLIDRVFGIMARAGRIPPPPREIVGTPIKVTYISLLAQAQRMVTATPIERLLGFVGQVAAVQPSILDKLDLDKAIDTYAEAIGAPPTIVLDSEAVARVRAQKAQMARAQAMLQAGAQVADMAKTASETPMANDKTALDNFMAANQMPAGGRR